MHIRRYRSDDQQGIVSLWEQCGLTRSWNDPRKDIARKLKVQSELFLVGILDGTLVASVMAGYEGHRGWINYLAVAPACRGRGFGRALMDRAEELLLAMGCPKINLQVRSTNTEVLAFYKSIGYVVDETVSMGKRLIPDD